MLAFFGGICESNPQSIINNLSAVVCGHYRYGGLPIPAELYKPRTIDNK
jgi:hypothetical protein